MIDINEVLNTRKNISISAVAIGQGIAENTVIEIARHSSTHIGVKLFDRNPLLPHVWDEDFNSNLIYVVVEGDTFFESEVSFIEQLTSSSDAIVIGICIGDIQSQNIKERFMSITKAFFFQEECRIHKYIALFTKQLEKALRTEVVLGIELNDLNKCLSGSKNSIWYGKSFGCDKGQDLVRKLKNSEWFRRNTSYCCDNMLTIISGDISLTDANDAFSSVSGIQSDKSYALISVVYEEDAYDEMSMLVIVSK